MNLIRNITFLAIAITASALANSQEVGFKGVPLGASKESLLEKFPGLRCYATPKEYAALGEETCTKRYDSSPEDGMPLETYAGQRIESLSFGVADGLFGYFSLTIEPRHYEQIKTSVEVSLGKGVQTERQIQSMGGIKLQSRTLLITKSNGTLTVAEHAGQINEGRVTGNSRAFQTYVERVLSERAKKGSSDI